MRGVALSRACYLSLAVLLAACGGPARDVGSTSGQNSAPANAGRYALEKDVPVLEPFDVAQVKTVVPVPVRRTLAGNKSPYTVNGRSYQVMETEAGYTATGRASWYGRKFHGHLTSNGEVYDMFQLSAAHRSLPIPSYARVTNLENGKQVLVRVNDRGPFHSDRIIDLSYAAASMLGYADQGTARVRIEAIVPDSEPAVLVRGADSPGKPVATRLEIAAGAAPAGVRGAAGTTVSAGGTDGEYLQVGAFSSIEVARNLLPRLAKITTLPVSISSKQTEGAAVLHKVRLGPLNERVDMDSLIRAIVDADLGTPFKVRQ